MLTNNWRAQIERLLTGSAGQFRGESGKYNQLYSNNFNVMKVEIGTGTTPANTTDYKLESVISSGYKALINPSVTHTVDDVGGTNVIANIINTSNSDNLTFSEIGLLGNDYSTQAEYILFAREVFDTPITIAPGETKSFVMKLF